jgi:hypothetical protein
VTERFEQEFYTSPWCRVLPLGPYGIQPYVWPDHGRRMRRSAADLRRLGASIGRALERIAAFGCRVAVVMTRRPMLERTAPRPPRAARPRTVRPARAGPQRLRRAA